MIKDKRGGEKYLSIWWFFVLVVIAIGIFAGVAVFYSHEIDVRELEADILITKISDCLIKNGQVSDEVFNENFDFSECGLDKSFLIEEGYILNVLIYDFETCKKECEILNSFGFGDVKNCEIKKATKKARYFPLCSEKDILVFNDNKKLILHIIAGSNQKGERIST